MKTNLILGMVVGFLIIILAIIFLTPSETELEATGNIVESGEMNQYIDISVDAAKRLIEANPDIIILDVSSAYENGHIPGAINYYVGDGSLDEAIPSLDPESTYLVYCHFESASRLGAQKLINAGFENVYRLEGNYAGWVDAGYGVEY